MRMPPVASAVGRTARPNIDPAEWEQRVNLAACYRLIEHFDNPVMILRNHGLLAVGKSIPLAFSNLFNLQFACETQVLAMAGNAALTLPAPAVSEHTAKLALAPDAPFGTEWAGLLRKLDRIDPSYRT